eukprot:3837306-Alexandrium_andersonii.AAC.1
MRRQVKCQGKAVTQVTERTCEDPARVIEILRGLFASGVPKDRAAPNAQRLAPKTGAVRCRRTAHAILGGIQLPKTVLGISRCALGATRKEALERVKGVLIARSKANS